MYNRMSKRSVEIACLIAIPIFATHLPAQSVDDAKPSSVSTGAPDKGDPGVKVGFFSDEVVQDSELEGIPEDLFFDRYVPIMELAEAWETTDSGKLADLAIQAEEGKRILLRERRGISNATLWSMAIRAAEVQGNTDVMTRLASAADRYALKAESDRLQTALKLAGESRAVEVVAINPATVSVEDFTLLQDYSKSIDKAALRGDTRYLQDVKYNSDRLFPNAEHRKVIEGLLNGPLSHPAETSPDWKSVIALDTLLADSRGWGIKIPTPHIPTPNIPDPTKAIREAAERAAASAKAEAKRAAEYAQQRADAARRAAQAEADRLSATLKDVARDNISITAEWQYEAWVPDPYRLINFAIREMYYDASANRLTFQVIGRIPIRSQGSAKIPGRISSSLQVDLDVDYGADVIVDFSSQSAQITAQPQITNFSAQLSNVRFNADLANWFRGKIQDSLNRKVQSENPRVQRFISEAISRLNLTYDGQAQLRSIAERIRQQLPAARSGTIGVGTESLDALLGTWQTDGRSVTFDRGLATIRTERGSAQFSYSFDPTTGMMVGVDTNGARTETYIRWLAPNSIEWKSPTGQRHYVKASDPSIAMPTVPTRIDLRYLGAAFGGAIEEYLKEQFANYRPSDSGSGTWHPYDN